MDDKTRATEGQPMDPANTADHEPMDWRELERLAVENNLTDEQRARVSKAMKPLIEASKQIVKNAAPLLTFSEETHETFRNIIGNNLIRLIKDDGFPEAAANITDDMIANPYSDSSRALLLEILDDLDQDEQHRNILSLYDGTNDANRAKADEITNGAIGRLADFIRSVRLDHSTLIMGVRMGNYTAEDIGLTKEDFQAQDVHRLQHDIREIYEFMYSRSADGTTDIIPRFRTTRPDRDFFAMDKTSRLIWGIEATEKELSNGVIARHVDVGNNMKGQTVNVNCVLDLNGMTGMDGVSFSRPPSLYDGRVHGAICTLAEAGVEYTTYQQIYSLMREGGRAGSADIKNIRQSLDSMGATRITIDNKEEAETYPNKKKFIYRGNLLFVETIEAEVNGKMTKNAVHIIKKPPLYLFTKNERQETMLPAGTLGALSLTDANMRLENYLVYRIAKMKRWPKEPRKIVFATICEHMKLPNRREISRLWGKVETILQHHRETRFIKDFRKTEDGFDIYLYKKGQKIPPRDKKQKGDKNPQ